jgi:hypothetical protein
VDVFDVESVQAVCNRPLDGNYLDAAQAPADSFTRNCDAVAAIGAYSRLAYSEMLTDECKDTASEFWERANACLSNRASLFERC